LQRSFRPRLLVQAAHVAQARQGMQNLTNRVRSVGICSHAHVIAAFSSNRQMNVTVCQIAQVRQGQAP
jgi:hypothetical protein